MITIIIIILCAIIMLNLTTITYKIYLQEEPIMGLNKTTKIPMNRIFSYELSE